MEQVSELLRGREFLGPPQDIREVKNAYEAYDLLAQLNPYKVKDLLKAHKVMMTELVKEAGIFRSTNVGGICGDRINPCRNTAAVCTRFDAGIIYMVKGIKAASLD